VLYPDPEKRTVLDWRIRWIAGLVSLLLVAVGTSPGMAAESRDARRDGQAELPYVSSDHEQTSAPDLDASTDRYLGSGSKSGSEFEPQEQESDASPAAVPVATPIVEVLRAPSRRDVDAPRSFEAAGRLCSRAPPLA
jgi:hypothetical protein